MILAICASTLRVVLSIKNREIVSVLASPHFPNYWGASLLRHGVINKGGRIRFFLFRFFLLLANKARILLTH